MKRKRQIGVLTLTLFSIFFTFAVMASGLPQSSTTESDGMKLRVEQVAELPGVIWGMTFISKTQMLITERSGVVYLFDLTTSKLSRLKNIPVVKADGQGGMLDVAVSPAYQSDGWIYFTYVKAVAGMGATTLARAKLQLDTLSLVEWTDLLVSKSTTDTSHHFGSRITFDGKGHVFFGIGDRGQRPNAQDLSNHAGSILRLNLDGSVPADNPFTKNKQALPEIWSYGHRNPQGLFFDPTTDRLWEIEHGPRGGDEINLILPGLNYGWPVISYGKEYWGPVAVGEGTHHTGMEQPVKVYIPSIAPGSLMVYSGKAFATWQGNLFTGALKLQHINRVVLDANGKAIKEERILESLKERIRALVQGPEGGIYFSTDSGKIFKLMPATDI